MNEKENVFTIIPTIELSFKNKRSNGTERVVLKTFNRVYCLNEDLITIGTSEDFATNKNTREINFVGNIAYLRTLSTKDPCYAVDLNDPHHPKIIPELEQLSQFTYLHIYGNGAVLGFNQDLNSKTGKVTGLEISVYDVSSDNYSTGITTWSHVWEPGEYINETSRYNEEGLILDAQNGLIGIPLSDLMYDEVSNIWTLDVEYKMFHYQNNTISESGSINFTINDIRADMRLIRTDNYLHLISDTRLLTISPTDYSVVNEIVF